MFFNVFCDFDVKNKKYMEKNYFNIFLNKIIFLKKISYIIILNTN